MAISERSTEPLIKRVVLAFFAQIVLASIHHVYGGLIYNSTLRMSQPVFASIEFLIVLGILFWYRQTGSRVARTVFIVLMTIVGVVQGLFHTLYGHVYKDLLFLVGIPADRVRNFFLPVIPNDFIYPPDNFFFEATGWLELVTIYLIVVFTYRLFQSRRYQK